MPQHARWDPSEPENVEPNKAYNAKLSCVDKHDSKARIKLTYTILLFWTSFKFLKQHNICRLILFLFSGTEVSNLACQLYQAILPLGNPRNSKLVMICTWEQN